MALSLTSVDVHLHANTYVMHAQGKNRIHVQNFSTALRDGTSPSVTHKRENEPFVFSFGVE